MEQEHDTTIYFGGEVKALGDGKVGGYLVRFTNPKDVDLEGEYFDAATDFGSAKTSDAYYAHGIDTKLARRVIGKGDLSTDDVGVWIEAQLELRDEYEQAIYSMASAGKLGWSSGTAAHLVEKEAKDNAVHITKWPLGLDASLTPTPAEPRNTAMPLKSFSETVQHSLEVESQDAGDASTTTTAGESVTVNVYVSESTPVEEATTEVKTTMSEKETVVPAEVPGIDIEEVARLAAEEAVKAYQEELAKAPAINAGKAGIVVTGDEADRALEGNPYKSFGEFLMAVKSAGLGSVPEKRLLPLRGPAEVEGGFSMAKAMGPKFVGSMYGRKATKAPTGLGELIPSAGGYLVDTDRNNSLMAAVYDTGDLLNRVSMFPVSGNANGMTFYGEDETSRADGSRRGGVRAYWAAEAAEKTASQPKFREIELKLRKVIGLVYATDELLQDTAALESYIMQVMPEELRFVVEDAIINGSGAGQPLGILNSGALVSVAKETGQLAATIVSENLDKMWSRMRPVHRQAAVWLINQDCETQLASLNRNVGTGGALVYSPPGGLSAAPYATIKGRPVVATEYNATLGTVGDIMLCDLRQYYAIEKGGVQTASSIHVRFVYDESCFRFVLRVDGQPNIGDPLTPYKGTNTLSPFVALATRS